MSEKFEKELRDQLANISKFCNESGVHLVNHAKDIEELKIKAAEIIQQRDKASGAMWLFGIIFGSVSIGSIVTLIIHILAK